MKLTQSEMLDLVLDDLARWSYGSDYDDSMLYALRNGYKLHAANLWLGTGAASPEVIEKTRGLRISRAAEEQEIKLICKNAHIYICPDCNHHGFYDNDEGGSVLCLNCLKTAIKKVG